MYLLKRLSKLIASENGDGYSCIKKKLPKTLAQNSLLKCIKTSLRIVIQYIYPIAYSKERMTIEGPGSNLG